MVSDQVTSARRSVNPYAAYQPSTQPDPISSLASAPRTPISIVSDARIVREGLVMLLQPYVAVDVIGSYAGLPLPNGRLPSAEGHIVLLDCAIGTAAVFAWTQYWRDRPDSAYVLALELEDDPQTVLACIEAGINGFTLRGAAPKEIGEAILLARQGHAQCSPHLISQLFMRLASIRAMDVSQAYPALPLTNRELQVLELLTKGYSNKEIALALTVALRTVKHHVHNILHKLKLSNRRQAVAVALEWGLVRREETNTPHQVIASHR